MAIGKKNKIKLNPLDYNIMFSGPSKIGKTTLIREVCEKLVGRDGYLFCETGTERGADAIEGINYVDAIDWNSDYDEEANTVGFSVLIDDIVNNKTSDYADLKVLVIDTLDHWIDIADQETIRIYNQTVKEYDKRAQSIAQAFAGYGRGEDKSIELMLGMIDRLNKVGVRVIIIGHCKTKTITDPITGVSYDTVTSNQPQKYYNAFVNNLHFNAVSYIKRDIKHESTGKKDFDGKEKFTNEVVNMERRIKFREPNYVVDAGGRFADIIEEIPFDADEFINALTDAIKKERDKSNRSLEEDIAEQKKAEKDFEAKVAEKEKKQKEEQELSNLRMFIGSFVKSNLKTDAAKKVMALCKEEGFDNPLTISSLSSANKIKAYIESL